MKRPTLEEALAAAGDWIPFAARTAGYGLASCVGGPLTNGEYSLECMRRWCESSLEHLWIDVTVRNAERVGSAGPCVIVSNHNSMLDILVLGSVLGVDYKWAAKRSLFRVPFLGWHLALAGHIPIDREKRHGMRALERQFQMVLETGKYVLIFPEGTRSPDGEIQPFKMGAFQTAVRNGVPVVPVVIDGTQALMHKGAIGLAARAERKVSVRVLHPLTARAEGHPRERATALRDQTRRIMVAALEQMRGRTTYDSASLVVV